MTENQPSGDVSVIQPSQIFERNLIENGELFQVIDHSPIMKAQSGQHCCANYFEELRFIYG